MTHRLFLMEGVQVRGELAGAEAVILRKPRGDRLRLLARHVQLGAIARRQDRRFLGESVLHLGKRLAQALDVEHYALAYRERSCLMVQPESIKWHGEARSEGTSVSYKRYNALRMSTLARIQDLDSEEFSIVPFSLVPHV